MLHSHGFQEPALPGDHEPVRAFYKNRSAAEIDYCHRIRQPQFFCICVECLTQVKIWFYFLGVEFGFTAVAVVESHFSFADYKNMANQFFRLMFIKGNNFCTI